MKSRKRKGVWIFLLLLILIAAAGFLGYNLLEVNNIEVSGNKKFSKEYIENLSGIQKGENLFKIDMNMVKTNIESNPYFIVDSVDRQLPKTIFINITEREPAALILFSGTNIILNNEGIILEIVKEVELIDYPVVSGLNISSFSLGKKVKTDDDYKIVELKTLLEEMNKANIKKMISEIDLSNPNNIKLISKYGILIKLGQIDRLEEKMKWINAMLPELIKQGKTRGSLDVSTAKSAYFYEPD